MIKEIKELFGLVSDLLVYILLTVIVFYEFYFRFIPGIITFEEFMIVSCLITILIDVDIIKKRFLK